MANELNVALRVQAQLDQARKAVSDFKKEVVGLADAGSSTGVGAGVDTTAAQAATTALREQTNATKAATEAASQQTAASAEAAVAQEKLAVAAAESAQSEQKKNEAVRAATEATEQQTTASAEAAAAQENLAATATDVAQSEQQNADATRAAAAATEQHTDVSTDAAVAQENLAATTRESAAAEQQKADATQVATTASEQNAAATEKLTDTADKAVIATEKERRAIEALVGELEPGAAGAQKMAEAQAQLDAALKSGLISQEQHNRMMALAQQRWASAGVSAKQTAAAMRMLPAQITDITTSLASGMPIWLVAVQQGGQIKDSFGGIGPAAKAMTSMLNPARLVIAGIGAAILATTLAYFQGRKESSEFTKAIVMNGNAAGVTVNELHEMAEAVSDIAGTQGQAAEVLTLLAASGRVSRDNLAQFAESTIKWESATGQAVSATVKEFEELGKAPVEASRKLNERYNYLTAAVYQQIKALQDEGRNQEAATLAQQTYSNALQTRSQEIVSNLGLIETAWKNIGAAAKWAWDQALDIGRPDTPADILTKAQDELHRAVAAGWNKDTATGAQKRRYEAALEAIRAQSEILKKEEEQARQQAENQRIQQEGVAAADALATAYEKALTKEQRLEKALAEHRLQVEKLRKADPNSSALDPTRLKASEKAIRDGIMGTGDKGSSAADIAAQQIKSGLSVLQASIRDGDALIVKALDDGRVDIETAYEQRLAALQQDSQAQRDALEKELAAKGTSKARKIEIQAQLKVLGTSLAAAERELAAWRKAEELKLSDLTVRLRVDTSALTGQFDRDAIEQQLRQRYAEDLRIAGRNSDPVGAEKDRKRIELLIQAGAAQAEFNNKLDEASRLQAQLGVIEQAIQNQVSAGQISQIEGEARIAQARAAQVPVLQSIATELERIRNALPSDAVVAIDAMNVSIGNLQNTATAATPVIVTLGTRLRNTMIDGLADAGATAVANFENLRDAAGTMLKQIAADIVRSDIKRLLTNLFTPSGEGGSTLVGGIFGGIKSAFGFAEGGRIVGPGTGTSDSIPALVDGKMPIAVSNGEFIQPTRAVAHYGEAFMEAVRTLRFPKPQFAFGGLVAASRKASFATGGRVSGGEPTAGQAAVPNVTLQVTNTGTPQRVDRQESRWDGKDLVVSVMLADARDGGPISRAFGVRR